MAEDTKITTKDVATVSAVLADDVHPLVGERDGHVNDRGETLVYEYDAEGNFAGWHFAPAEETK